MSFEKLGISARLATALAQGGITDPTPIQAGAIPHAMDGKDIFGIAQTGTGKTAAFGLPLIDRLEASGQHAGPKKVSALILAPTRELAGQIVTALKGFMGNRRGLRIGLVTGGVSINTQIRHLSRGTEILVATPGRLIDLLDRKSVDLSHAQYLVLDEADQMLDMGFIHALRRIAPLLPTKRQTMLFSATMPKQMEEISQAYLTDPVKVEVSPPGKPADKVRQSVHFVAKDAKNDLLIELLSRHKGERALVFGRTKHGSERLMKKLVSAGFSAASIHGNKTQGQRNRALDGFRSGDITVLVATDVAARGLDIPGVEFVYNYDLPNVPENYVHRIGRTARAGAEGEAVAFCASDEMAELKDIEKVLGRKIEVVGGRPWEVDTSAPKKTNRRRRGGGGGGGQNGGGKPKAAAKPQGARPQKARRRRPNKSRGQRAA